jgi:anti-anti-sigma factor
MSDLGLQTQEHEGWVLVIARGSIDAQNALGFEERLEQVLAKRPPRLALDMAAVGFLSSLGLRVLLTSLKAVAGWNGRFHLVAPTPSVRKVLSASGLDRIFVICDSRDALSAS